MDGSEALFTRLSQKEYDEIRKREITSEEAYNCLSSLKVRTFSEILRNFSGKTEPELKRILVDGFSDGNSVQDSVMHKVRDWLSDKYAPSERDDFIRICFILGLSEEDAENFMLLSTGEAFHLRELKEVTFLYSIRTGRSYSEAMELLERVRTIVPEISKAKDSDVYTHTVASLFNLVKNDEDFSEFLEKCAPDFGAFHNTAYFHFCRFLALLINPDTESEEDYSVKTVVETYLRMNVPLDKKTSKYDVIAKNIKKYWPNTTSIIKMKNRSEDVSRRVLLLLYLITEGGVTIGGDDAYLLDEDFTDSERFDEHFYRINSLLADCGYATLDPRSVFDWLVLYSLRSENDCAMSEKLENTLNTIFRK